MLINSFQMKNHGNLLQIQGEKIVNTFQIRVQLIHIQNLLLITNHLYHLLNYLYNRLFHLHLNKLYNLIRHKQFSIKLLKIKELVQILALHYLIKNQMMYYLLFKMKIKEIIMELKEIITELMKTGEDQIIMILLNRLLKKTILNKLN